MSTSRRSITAAAVMLATGCLAEHGPLSPTNSTVRLALRVELQMSAAGERVVEIRARYRRASGDPVTLPVQPTQVTIADGTTVQQPVVINVGACNADASRAAGGDEPAGCRFTVELTLKNGSGETLSSATQDFGPVGSGPPETPTFVLSAPNLTVAPADLNFTARAQQPVPTAQTVAVNASNSGATLGTIGASVEYTNGQGWLRASIDQGSHTLSIQPTTTALAVGTYRAIVGVTSSVEGMKAQTVPVTYQVVQSPVLTVTGGGGGSGSVTSSPAGISCTITGGTASGTCSAPFTPNASVTLTAAPTSGSTFGGWGGGACSGQGTCVVTLAQSATVSATFNLPVPVLQLSPTSLSFSGQAGTAGPARQTVSVVNGGGGTLSGVAITNTRQDGSEPAWLDATLSGATISVGASPARLQAGTYTGSIVVGSANGGSATLAVTFAVGDQPPVLRLSPTSLSFAGSAGGSSPARQTVAALNAGGGTLAGVVIRNITYGGSEPDWLDANASGSTISVGANPGRLTPGSYTATVLVGSANGGNASFTVTFAVAAAPPPILQLSPTSLSFSAVSGGSSPPAQSVSVVNGGPGTLAGVSITTIRQDGSEPTWLGATLSGTTISVNASPANLQPGTYTGSVVVGSTNGGSATLAVTFNVAARAPVLTLSPASISFSGVSNGPNPARQSVAIVNAGGGTLAGVAVSNITYPGFPPSQWVDPVLTGTTLSVGAVPAKLPPGNYTATVLIVSSNGGNATLSVSIAVTAPPPILALTPNALSFTGVVGVPISGKTSRATNIGSGTVNDVLPLTLVSKPSFVNVSFDGSVVVVTPVAGLGTGVGTGTVTINSPRGGNATISVTISITTR